MAGYTDVTGDDVWDHPHVRAVMPQILGAVTGPDGDLRRRVTSWVAGDACPALRGRVVDDLVDRLASRSPEKRDRAAGALLAIGGPALPTLVMRLRRAARTTVPPGLAAVVGRIGRTLPTSARSRLLTDLALVLSVVGDLDSARAVARAVVLARSDGPAAGEASPDAVEMVVAIGARLLMSRRPTSAGAAGAECGSDSGAPRRRPLTPTRSSIARRRVSDAGGRSGVAD